MFWLYLIIQALVLGLLSSRLKGAAEGVYSIAASVAGLISFIWGIAWAPALIQSIIGILLFLLAEVYILQLEQRWKLGQ